MPFCKNMTAAGFTFIWLSLELRYSDTSLVNIILLLKGLALAKTQSPKSKPWAKVLH